MKTESKTLRRSIAAILAPLAGVVALPAHATTYVVSTLADSGAGSLRQAMLDANASDTASDSISFGVTGTITLVTGLPAVGAAASQGALTISGPGVSSLTITGSSGIQFIGVGGGGNLTVSDLTVTGANANAYGSAFYSSGALTISGCTVSNNLAVGGAIYGGGDSVTVSNSLITGNTSTYGGAAYIAGGSLTVINSTVSNNSATGYSGGLFARNNVTVTNSTISGNSSRDGGGLLVNAGSAANIYITNSTISGNSATNGHGGGVFLEGPVSANIINSTISGNSASNSGGGIYAGNNGTSSTVFVANSIIANSTSGGDFSASGGATISALSPATASNNLVTIGSPSWATTVSSANLNLGSLQNNGGPTSTIALGAGSFAIGAGNATISNAAPVNGVDQRGYTRSANAPSIGAYEYNGIAPTLPTPTLVSPTSGSISGGTSITITGSGFTGTTGVTIGGAHCTGLVVSSDTSITCTTPAGAAGAASVLITNGNGTNSANALFNYTSFPPASIPSLSAWTQTVLAMLAGVAIWWHEKKQKFNCSLTQSANNDLENFDR